jgi:hypothetical protein
MFTDGPEDEDASEAVRDNLCTIAGTTCLLHELYVACLVGRAQFLDWAQSWVSTAMPANLVSGLAERLELLEDFCS